MIVIRGRIENILVLRFENANLQIECSHGTPESTPARKNDAP